MVCTEKEIEFQRQIKVISLKVTIYGPITAACFLTLDKSGKIYLLSQLTIWSSYFYFHTWQYKIVLQKDMDFSKLQKIV